MAQVVRLTTKPERMKRETATELRQLILAYPEADLPAHPRAALLNALTRVTSPNDAESIWPGGFTMISRKQTKAVWDAIRQLPGEKRPNEVRHAFDLVLLNLNQDTGEVMLSRDQIAIEMKRRPNEVSTVMGVLEEMGVLYRERRKIAGMQGPGMVVYLINPHVAWNGSLEVREQARRRSRSLR